MRQKPIEKEHIARRAGQRPPRRLREPLRRNEDLPIRCLLVHSLLDTRPR
jgi:hypothetical protein